MRNFTLSKFFSSNYIETTTTLNLNVMNKIQTKFIILTIFIALTIPSSFATSTDKTINIDGSSTVYPISKGVADSFQSLRKVKVNVNLSGTGGGFAKFCRGETEIQDASRPILKKEMEICKDAGIQYIELPIAYDAITVVVNKNNDFVKSLSIEDLKKIWRPAAQGQIKTWRQVNSAWPNTPLNLYGQNSDSGTFDYFTETVVGKAKSSRRDYNSSGDNNVLLQSVKDDVGALGYFSYSNYTENADGLLAVPIAANKNAMPVLPSIESVKNGAYVPFSRPLFIYVNATAAAFRPEVREFIDYYIYLQGSPKLVQQAKYIPLPANEYEAVYKHWKALKPGTGFDGVPEVGVRIDELLARIK
jgi:phosphate transport system substrate-binding protein